MCTQTTVQWCIILLCYSIKNLIPSKQGNLQLHAGCLYLLLHNSTYHENMLNKNQEVPYWERSKLHKRTLLKEVCYTKTITERGASDTYKVMLPMWLLLQSRKENNRCEKMCIKSLHTNRLEKYNYHAYCASLSTADLQDIHKQKKTSCKYSASILTTVIISPKHW